MCVSAEHSRGKFFVVVSSVISIFLKEPSDLPVVSLFTRLLCSDLGLDVLDGVAALHLERDGLARETCMVLTKICTIGCCSQRSIGLPSANEALL